MSAFQSDPKWLAQCAASKERREQLAVRQQQAAALRQRNLCELEKKQAKASAVASASVCAAHPHLTSTRDVATRATKYETDAKWLAQCAAGAERRRELAARHNQDANSRWRSANCDDVDADLDRRLQHDGSASTHATSAAKQSTALASENSVVRRVREQQAEGRERRARLTEQHRQEEQRRWLRANAHCSGDDYAPPAASSLLAWPSVEEAAAELVQSQRPRRCR